MSPGRDLDALVAEHVMGWTRLPVTAFEGGGPDPADFPTATETETIVPPGFDLGDYRPPVRASLGEALSWKPRALPEVPPYSTRLDAAWEVVERLIEHMRSRSKPKEQFGLELGYVNDAAGGDPSRLWNCQGRWIDKETDDHWDFAAWGDTQSHAICMAALKAVGVET